MARAPVLQTQDSYPEADRLEGFPHPRHTRQLFGHVEEEAAFANGFGAGRMHHAWLVTGPTGIGKATLAYRFAKYVLSDARDRMEQPGRLDVSPDSVGAKGVEALSHTGLFVIRRQWDIKTKRFPAQIRVDDVRRLRGFLSHRSGEGQWRVVIVDAADEMNIPAANALLKSLEEPPIDTVFLLLSSEPGRLLNTIRSRCRRLDLAPLSKIDLTKATRQAIAGAEDGTVAVNDADVDKLAGLSGGSVGRLLTLAAGGGAEMQDQIWSMFASLPKLDWGKGHILGDTLSPVAAAERFELFFNLLLDLLARLVRVRATDDGGQGELELARRLIKDGQLASWAALWETVARDKADAMALNLDRKTLILTTLARLETAAR